MLRTIKFHFFFGAFVLTIIRCGCWQALVPAREGVQARETVERRTQDGQPSVQADRVGSFGLPRRRGAIYARGCQGHKGGTRGQAPHARHARAATPARVCGGGRQGWRRSNCRAPYLPSGLIARAHRASWSTCGVGGRGRGAQADLAECWRNRSVVYEWR